MTVSPNHKDRGHSEFGGSGAERWLACSASIIDARGLPPLPSSQAAEEGTKDHELAELLLKGGAMPDDVDPDRKARVESYVEHVNQMRFTYAGAEEVIEGLVELSPESWGSADYALVHPFGHGYLCDYKGGIKEVVCEENAQLAFYAVCLAEKYDLTAVTVQVFQPKLGGASPTWTLDLVDLRRWRARFMAAIAKATKGLREHKAGAHCKYCRVAGTCEALATVAIEEAQMDFAAPAPAPVSPAAMATRDISKVLALADTIEAWLASVRQAAMELALKGEEIPGFKVVEGRAGNRKWTNEVDVVKTAIAAGIDPYERTVISPTKMEKDLGKKGFNAQFGDLVSRAPGKPTLVPLTDKRPAIAVTTAALDFSEE